MPKLIPITPKKFVKILLVLGFQKRDAEGSHLHKRGQPPFYLTELTLFKSQYIFINNEENKTYNLSNARFC